MIFLSLRNLLSNELFFAFCEFAIASFFNLLKFNDTESKLKLYCMCRNNMRNLLDYKGYGISILYCIKVSWFYLITKPNFTKLKLALEGLYHGIIKNFSGHPKYLN